LNDDVEVLRRALAPRAKLRWHGQIRQPATFGWRRPVILLPDRVAAEGIDAQRAIVCHELLHVARGDWIWTLVEQAIQCVFWFHPAMWWTIAQIQLSREEAIDHRVVTLIGARQSYMSALMLFADAPPALAPAIPFIRRRHLISRITKLSKEHAMSRMRFVVAATALTGVTVMSAWAALSAFPLDARASLVVPVPAAPGPATAIGEATPRGTRSSRAKAARALARLVRRLR
jgi:beta-lactamase regulating signal transducer with metallopeptidase domain